MTVHPENERGRDFVPTGRGGAGNAVRSPSRGRPGETAEEVKAAADYHAQHGTNHGGRGGAGNVRSPSRDPADRKRIAEEEKREHAIQAEAIKKDQAAHHSHTGRGGVGNIPRDSSEHSKERGRESGGIGSAIRSLSKSRSRSRDPHATSSQPASTYDGDKLGSVQESSSTLNGAEGKSAGEKQGIIGKIASHLPHHHSSN